MFQVIAPPDQVVWMMAGVALSSRTANPTQRADPPSSNRQATQPA
jgi:hypothetical protein